MEENISVTNPVTKVPAEVWEIIADNLVSGNDVASLSEAVTLCGKVSYPRRVEWMFEQVLPILLTHNKDLSQKDILNCGTVCKRWGYAVELQIENNLINNSISISVEDADLDKNPGHWEPVFPYKTEFLDIATMDRKRIQAMLKISDLPGNKILGKYVKMDVPTANRTGGIDLVNNFLEKFGPHIKFLHLTFPGKTDPITLLNILVPVLQLVPNLKKLVIEKYMRTDLIKQFPTRKVNDVTCQLIEFNENRIKSDNFINAIPKLETLSLFINGMLEYDFKHLLIKMFTRKCLKTVTVSELFVSPKDIYLFHNLRHLNLQLKMNEQIESLMVLNFKKLERLGLNLGKGANINCELLFQVLRKFQSTLTHLELTLPNLLETFTLIANGSTFIGESKLMSFSDSGVLQMPKLKVLTLLGFRPPSFNFISGLKTLEQLNLYFDRQIVWEHVLQGLYHPDVKRHEKLDIIRNCKDMWSARDPINSRPQLQSSNVWYIFSAMKTMKVYNVTFRESVGNTREWKYTRNHFANKCIVIS